MVRATYTRTIAKYLLHITSFMEPEKSPFSTCQVVGEPTTRIYLQYILTMILHYYR